MKKTLRSDSRVGRFGNEANPNVPILKWMCHIECGTVNFQKPRYSQSKFLWTGSGLGPHYYKGMQSRVTYLSPAYFTDHVRQKWVSP